MTTPIEFVDHAHFVGQNIVATPQPYTWSYAPGPAIAVLTLSSLFISFEIDCFHSQWTRKYLHSRTKSLSWLRYWLLKLEIFTTILR